MVIILGQLHIKVSNVAERIGTFSSLKKMDFLNKRLHILCSIVFVRVCACVRACIKTTKLYLFEYVTWVIKPCHVSIIPIQLKKESYEY